MTQKEAVNRWITSAQEDLAVADDLFEKKKYSYCLFFCHLSLEKILKAYLIRKTDDAPPITHDLLKLIKGTGMDASEKKIKTLAEMNSFNIEARYDIDKNKLYRKATKDYSRGFLNITKSLFLWIRNQISA